MTNLARCGWCARTLEPKPGAGRPRQYCKQSCRQQAFIARKTGEPLAGVDPEKLGSLLDAVYCLEMAIKDVRTDLKDSVGPSEVESAAKWLLHNAKACVVAGKALYGAAGSSI